MNKTKEGLFIFLFVIMLLPVMQHSFGFVIGGPLNGYYTLASDVKFSWQQWWDGTYQQEKSKYLNDNTGLRPDIIRLNNQLDYTLFRKIHSEWRLFFGSDNCTYEDANVYSYTGKDFIGDDSIRHQCLRLRAIQDTLLRMGKSLIIVHAPSKAFYYPEHIPPALLRTCTRHTSLATYVRLCDSLGIHQVDFNAWFIAMKNKTPELLYPRQGFHWSVYGSLLAGDSLERYIEKDRNVRMVHPQWTNTIHTDEARYTDDDITKGMNLIFPVMKETYTYPEVQYRDQAGTTKPGIIFIGDSFLQTWVSTGFMDATTTRWQVWYYNYLLIDKEHKETPLLQLPRTEGLDWAGEIERYDCIVLLYTSRNLNNLGGGFIERAYAYYYPNRTL